LLRRQPWFLPLQPWSLLKENSLSLDNRFLEALLARREWQLHRSAPWLGLRATPPLQSRPAFGIGICDWFRANEESCPGGQGFNNKNCSLRLIGVLHFYCFETTGCGVFGWGHCDGRTCRECYLKISLLTVFKSDTNSVFVKTFLQNPNSVKPGC